MYVTRKRKAQGDISTEGHDHEMIIGIFRFLKEEYDYLRENTFCDLSQLSFVQKRVAKAADISLYTLKNILRNEKYVIRRTEERKSFCKEDCKIIAGLYHLFEEEYNILRKKHYENCCLTFLADIRKRTADATGVSEDGVTAILLEEGGETKLKDSTSCTTKRKTCRTKSKKNPIKQTIHDSEEEGEAKLNDSTSCTTKRKTCRTISKEGRDREMMLIRIFRFLKEEYDYLLEKTFCDLTLLSFTLKRVAEVADISTNTLRKKIRNERRVIKRTEVRKIICEEDCKIIARLYYLLEEEYNIYKEKHDENCCLTFLANIRKRTADATGVSEDAVTAILVKQGREAKLKDNTSCTRKIIPAKTISKEVNDMIIRILHFLKEEYNYLRENTICDLSDLRDAQKRLLKAADVSTYALKHILRNKNSVTKQNKDYKNICEECRKIIARLYHLFEEEYNALRKKHNDSCCLTLLAVIRKRTADATGVSENDVTAILLEEQEELKKQHETDDNSEDENCLLKVKTEVYVCI